MRILVVQDRDRRFLKELAVLRVADREQAKVVAGFGSTTRANARLLALTRAGLLRRFFLGTTAGGRKALYTLTPMAAALVGVPLHGLRRRRDEALATDFFVEHQLQINRLYCSLKFKPIPVQGVHFVDWKTFEKPVTQDLHLIPDGYFEITTPIGPLTAFLEVDLGHESKKVWQEKANRYLEFVVSGVYERQFAKPGLRILVIANSERRLQSVRSVVAPLTELLFWFAALPDIDANGFFGAIWLRPRSDTKEAFVPAP